MSEEGEKVGTARRPRVLSMEAGKQGGGGMAIGGKACPGQKEKDEEEEQKKREFSG